MAVERASSLANQEPNRGASAFALGLQRRGSEIRGMEHAIVRPQGPTRSLLARS